MQKLFLYCHIACLAYNFISLVELWIRYKAYFLADLTRLLLESPFDVIQGSPWFTENVYDVHMNNCCVFRLYLTTLTILFCNYF